MIKDWRNGEGRNDWRDKRRKGAKKEGMKEDMTEEGKEGRKEGRKEGKKGGREEEIHDWIVMKLTLWLAANKRLKGTNSILNVPSCLRSSLANELLEVFSTFSHSSIDFLCPFGCKAKPAPTSSPGQLVCSETTWQRRKRESEGYKRIKREQHF